MEVWWNLDQDIINMAVDQWFKRLRTCIRANDSHISSTPCELTVTVTVYDLFCVTGLLRYSTLFVKLYKKCRYMLHNFCQVVEIHNYGEVVDLYPDIYADHFEL